MSLEYAARGLIGLLTPQANTTVEPEFSILLPAGFAHINARLVSDAPTLEQRLLDYAHTTRATLRQFANAPLRAIAFACTGSSYLLGAEGEAQWLADLAATSGVPACSAAQAIVNALHTLGARHIALLSPYPDALTTASAAYWHAHGFTVTQIATIPAAAGAFHPIYGQRAGALSERLAPLRARSDTDAVLVLGTGLPTLAPLRAAQGDPGNPGVPVLSSILCLAWQAVELAAPGAMSLHDWRAGAHWAPKLPPAPVDR